MFSNKTVTKTKYSILATTCTECVVRVLISARLVYPYTHVHIYFLGLHNVLDLYTRATKLLCAWPVCPKPFTHHTHSTYTTYTKKYSVWEGTDRTHAGYRDQYTQYTTAHKIVKFFVQKILRLVNCV